MGETPEELRAQIEAKRWALGGDLDAIGDRVSPGQIAARKKAEYRYRAGRTVDRLRVSVMGDHDDEPDHPYVSRSNPAVPSSQTPTSAGVVGGARDRIGDAASNVSDTVQETPDAIRRRTKGAPIAVGLISFGIGLLVSALLPETEVEQRAVERVQPQLEAITGELSQAGQDVAHDLQEPAQDAVDAVKLSAQQAAGAVKDDATHAAADVKDNAVPT